MKKSHNYCRTYQTSETISNQDSQKLNNTIHAIKIQLSEINTVSKKKNDRSNDQSETYW